jgi:hypothetical protein
LAPLSQRHSVVRFGTVVSIIANRQVSNKKEDNTGGMAWLVRYYYLCREPKEKKQTS